jgi:DNA-binding NtrC family response regulator
MVGRKRILLVDDDDVLGETLRDALTDEGYAVSLAHDGAAMRAVLARGEPHDAVVLDMIMPGEPSASLALYLKTLEMPLVMISGNAPMMKFAEKNQMQLLVKPFRAAALVEAIEEAIASREYGVRPLAPN